MGNDTSIPHLVPVNVTLTMEHEMERGDTIIELLSVIFKGFGVENPNKEAIAKNVTMLPESFREGTPPFMKSLLVKYSVLKSALREEGVIKLSSVGNQETMLVLKERSDVKKLRAELDASFEEIQKLKSTLESVKEEKEEEEKKLRRKCDDIKKKASTDREKLQRVMEYESRISQGKVNKRDYELEHNRFIVEELQSTISCKNDDIEKLSKELNDYKEECQKYRQGS